MSRRTSEANKAIAEVWANEQQLVKEGKGTRDWTREQQQDILERGKAYDENGKAFEGHHMKSVEKFPEYQGNAQNIQFLSRPEHAEAHSGNFQNPTNGFYDYNAKQTMGFGEDEFKPCEVINLSDPIFPPIDLDLNTEEVTGETKKESEEPCNGESQAVDTNGEVSVKKDSSEKQTSSTPKQSTVLPGKEKRSFGDRLLGAVEAVYEFEEKHPIVTGIVKVVAPLALGYGANRIANGGKSKVGKTGVKPVSKTSSSMKTTGSTLEKASESVAKVADALEKSSPIEHTVSAHRQRYNGKWVDKAPYHRGGKK